MSNETWLYVAYFFLGYLTSEMIEAIKERIRVKRKQNEEAKR